VDIGDLIWHRDFRLSGAAIRRPVIAALYDAEADSTSVGLNGRTPEDSLAAAFPSPDSLLYRVVANWLPDNVRGGRIDQLLVDRGTFVQRKRLGSERSFDSTADLTLGIEALQLDSTAHRVFQHGTLSFATFIHVSLPSHDSLVMESGLLTVAKEDTSYSLAMVRSTPGGTGHQLRLSGVARSQARHSLTIDTLTYGPVMPDAEFFREAPARSTRVRGWVRGIAVNGLQQSDILQRRLTPRTIRVDSANFDIVADRRLPPGPPRRRVLWPTRYAALKWIVGADSISLGQSVLRYGEMRPGQTRPAEISFESLTAVVTAATNDTALAGRGRPVVIQAQARLYGQGELSATIAVPVQPGPLRAQVRGRMSGMPLAPLNRFLTPGEGIQIVGGRVDKASFAFDVAGGLATGSFTAGYSDLDLSVVNPVTRKQNLGAKLKTLMAGLLTRGSNRTTKGGAVQPAPIRYRVEADDSFWGVMWQALRSGIVKAVKT
jgi:hypothetical protein